MPTEYCDPNIEQVAALRQRLWQAGFRPVALITNDKLTQQRGWLDGARRDPPAAVAHLPRAAWLNTGIICDGLRAVDLDIDAADTVQQVGGLAERLLGETLVRCRAASPRAALLYRAHTGEPGKRRIAGVLGKVEVLGYGQQLHAFGRHPSGARLRWWPRAPGAAMRQSLPAVTEAQIGAFLDAVAPLIGAAAAMRPRHPIAMVPRVPDDRQIDGLLRFVVRAPEGERNNRLFWAACRMAEMVASGMLGEGEAEALLGAAGGHAGMPEREARATARSGLAVGRHS